MDTLHFTPDHIARLFADLRLPGIAESFKPRYEMAVTSNTSLLEFVGTLLEEELSGRKNRRFDRLVHAANLDMNDGLENYDLELASEHGVDTRTLRDLAACPYIPKAQNIVLAGAVGTGKTKLARTLAFEAIRRDYRAVFNNTHDLIESLYRIRESYHFPKVYRSYVTADLLVLDDLAYMPFDPNKVEFLFRLVHERTEKKIGSLIVTTNTDVKEWWSFFPSKAMGMAFSDRILGGAYGIKFTGPSIRSKPLTPTP